MRGKAVNQAPGGPSRSGALYGTNTFRTAAQSPRRNGAPATRLGGRVRGDGVKTPPRDRLDDFGAGYAADLYGLDEVDPLVVGKGRRHVVKTRRSARASDGPNG
jgi:hypothetical protein